MAKTIKSELLPQISQAVAAVWLLAYLEADMQRVKQAELAGVA